MPSGLDESGLEWSLGGVSDILVGKSPRRGIGPTARRKAAAGDFLAKKRDVVTIPGCQTVRKAVVDVRVFTGNRTNCHQGRIWWCGCM